MKQILAVLLIAASAGACSRPAEAPAASPAAQAVESAAPAAAANTLESIPECERYLHGYQNCIESKVPEAARAMMKTSFDQARTQWNAGLAQPGGREAAASACQQANDAALQAVKAYGCSW